MILGFPNFASLEAKVLREKWFALELPRHLFHFTPSAVKALVKNSQLRLQSIKYVMTSFFLKSFFDERLDQRVSWSALAKICWPAEMALYLLGNRPYMLVYLKKDVS